MTEKRFETVLWPPVVVVSLLNGGDPVKTLKESIAHLPADIQERDWGPRVEFLKGLVFCRDKRFPGSAERKLWDDYLAMVRIEFPKTAETADNRRRIKNILGQSAIFGE